MDTIRRLLIREHDLHRALNSTWPPTDLDEQYVILRTDQEGLHRSLADLMEENHFWVSVHDARVRGFSERRRGNVRQARFFLDAIAYDKYDDGRESGYVRVDFSFSLPATSSLRSISNKVLHTALLDEQAKKIGFLSHPNNGVMSVSTAEYDRMDVRVGRFRTWGQLTQAQCAVGPWDHATLHVTMEGFTQEHHARWYKNGYLEVALQSVPDDQFDPTQATSPNDWVDYGEFAGGFYEPDHPSVLSVRVTTGERHSEVTANSGRRGMYTQSQSTTGKRLARSV